MSIADSQRPIEEASGVTKLTKLAFFFVPLAFSATLYGMQVKEFENKVNISTLVITAVVAVAGSYCLRLIVRGPTLRLYSR